MSYWMQLSIHKYTHMCEYTLYHLDPMHCTSLSLAANQLPYATPGKDVWVFWAAQEPSPPAPAVKPSGSISCTPREKPASCKGCWMIRLITDAYSKVSFRFQTTPFGSSCMMLDIWTCDFWGYEACLYGDCSSIWIFHMSYAYLKLYETLLPNMDVKVYKKQTSELPAFHFTQISGYQLGTWGIGLVSILYHRNTSRLQGLQTIYPPGD